MGNPFPTLLDTPVSEIPPWVGNPQNPPWVGNPFPTLLDTDLGLEIPFPPRLGIVEEYSEEDFTPTGDVKCCKKGGEGIPTHGGDFSFTGDFLFTEVCQEGWGRDSPPTGDFSLTGDFYLRSGVSRRVGNGFPTHGGDFSDLRRGFPTHGEVCHKKGGERIPQPRRGFLTHGQVC